MSARTIATNAVWSLISHVLNRGGLMIGAIVLARSLSPSQFASYSYFQMTVAMLTAYAALGLGITASRFFAEIGNEACASPPPVGTLLLASGLMAIVSFLLTLSIPASWLSTELTTPTWLVATGVAVSVASIVPGGAILGLEKYRAAVLVSTSSTLGLLGMVALSAETGRPELAMWGIVLGLTIQTLGQLSVIVRVVGWPLIRQTCRIDGIKANLIQVAHFAGPMFLVSVLAGSSAWIVGRSIIGASGGQEFAIYSIGLQWLALGMLLPGIISRVVLPRLVRSQAGDSRRLVRISAVMGLIPALLLCVAGFFLAPWLIRLYGDDYLSYQYVIPAFLVVAAINAPINTIGNAIVAKNGQTRWLMFSAGSFVALLVALIASPERTVGWAWFCHFASSLVLLVQTVAFSRRSGLV